MEQKEFNPFDLSAPPPKPVEAKPDEPVAPTPTVKKVSMGPIFHSRIMRTLALLLGIVLAGLIGYAATNYYLNRQAETENAAVQVIQA